MAHVYILKCRDGSYYVGSIRGELEIRFAEHNNGVFSGFTARRRPVEMIYSEYFDKVTDAIAAERQLKGWSRAKKEALVRGDISALRQLAQRKNKIGNSQGKRVAP